MARRSRRKPSFFKVLLDEFSNQLQIPPDFLVHFNGNVPQQFHLRTSAGTWCVNVEKINDRFFFQKGWKKFVHDNGLEICEFLVFRYALNLRFDVDIYGRNGCKKEFVTATGKTERPHEEGHDHVIHRKTPRNHGNQKVDKRGLKGSAYGTRTRQVTSPIQGEGYEATDDTDSQTLMHSVATSTGEANSCQRDNVFESENPFFKVEMRDTYIHRCYLTLPSKFVNAHLTEQPSTITLRVSDGRTWRVKVGFQTRGCQFLAGWITFVRDNELDVGDVCVFVLINKIEFLFEAVFYRKEEAENHHISSPADNPLQRANGFNSANPFFKVVMPYSSIHHRYMCVPYKFVKTHLADHPSNLTLCVSDGRTWPVKLVYEGARGRFIGGWSAFRRDNDLKLDDVCVFVLVNKVELTFEVAFYRKPEAIFAPCDQASDDGGSIGVEKLKEKRRSRR